MKKLFAIASAISALFISSCTNQINDTKKAYVTVSISEEDRTILPTKLEKNELIFELWGCDSNSSTKRKLSSWVSFYELISPRAIEVTAEDWKFSMRAFKNNVQVLEDNLTKKIEQGQNELYFKLKEVEGTGSINYYFCAPNSTEGTVTIKTTLYKEDNTVYESEKAISDSIVVQNNNEKYEQFIYKKENVPTGYYFLKVGVYYNSTLKDTWTTTIRVAAGSESKGTEYLNAPNYFTTLTRYTPQITYSSNTISWTAASSASSYDIYLLKSTTDLGAASNVDTALFTKFKNVTATTYNFTGSSLYYAYFAVKYKGSDSTESKFSNVVKVDKKALKASFSTSYVGVPADPFATGYNFKYMTTGTNYTLSTMTPDKITNSKSAASYSNYITISNGYYGYYAIQAYDEDTKSEFSNIVKLYNAAYYFSESGSPYYFTSSGNVWTSNNNGVDNTTASYTWRVYVPETTTVSIPYTVSSESYDKLTVYLDNVTWLSATGGTVSNTLTKSVAAGNHYVKAEYKKDGSTSSGNDKATLTLAPFIIVCTK